MYKVHTFLLSHTPGQLLSCVIVIDFESTCWEDKKGNQEISKLLVNVSTQIQTLADYCFFEAINSIVGICTYL